MEFFVKFIFWYWMFLFILRIFVLLKGDFPFKLDVSVAQHTGKTLWNMALLTWAAIVVFL